MLAALVLSGCDTLSGMGGGQTAATPAALPQRPLEPLAVFASQARPGEQSTLSPAPGAAPVRVQMVRSYYAASGRPCRELALGSGSTSRPVLYCEEPTGWAAARPLLRGGAVARP
ncbi:DVU3141 family protein [Teichococcus aestuarii]|nr:DVU3141 family protein [Pseudoroseomonas aestuarii]